MNKLAIIFPLILGLSHGDKSGVHVAAPSNTVQASAPSNLPPYYPEYDYGYEPQGTFSSSSASLTDRQASIEAVLGAPVVITAFAAALFGGILSPLISEGLSRMSDYQIEWPSFGQRVEKRRKTKVTKGSKARDFADSINIMDVLDAVNTVVSAISKRSVPDEDASVENISY